MERQQYPSLSPPPHYTDNRSHLKSGTGKTSKYGNGSWLLRRTSFTIESAPAAAENNGDTPSDQLSVTSSARSEEKRRLRNVISRFGRLGDEGAQDGRQSRSSEGTAHPWDGEQFGTTVSIEVGHNARPRAQRRHEMRGLEEAASMKRWAGSGKPADAWGKLAKVGLARIPTRNFHAHVPPPRINRYRTPNYGMIRGTLSFTSAISAPRPLSGSSRRSSKTPNPISSSPNSATATAPLGK